MRRSIRSVAGEIVDVTVPGGVPVFPIASFYFEGPDGPGLVRGGIGGPVKP